MATTSIRIANAASGNRIQAIDAVETDGDGYSTIMERIVAGSAKLPTVLGTATRGSSGMISAVDALDLTALPADLSTHLITVGDKTLLVVVCEMSLNTGTVTVTPLLYDSQATPVVMTPLESKTFSCYYYFRRGSSSGNYVASVRYWDVLGAYKIGLHITALSSSNTCMLWGMMI